jgi:hypothetical protein
VGTDVARVTTLCNGTIVVLRAVGVYRVGAVVLLVGFAVVAREIGTDLGTNTGAVADLDILNSRADLDDLANDLVAYAERERDILAPAASDGVDVGSADTAGVNGNVNIVLLELFERKLCGKLDFATYCAASHTHVFARELAPLLDVSDSEGVGGVWVAHCGCVYVDGWRV